MILSWQMQQWQALWRAKQSGRLPHALLLSGVAGIGKVAFAQHFSHALFCQQVTSEGMACDTCHACRLIKGGVHPSVLWLSPEKAGAAIKIDQVREVNEFVSQSSLQGNYRLVVINPADDMNANAANALLKTLEEPAAAAVILLISHQSGRLPATILSRCQRITLPRPKTDEALTWLQDKITDKSIDAGLLLNLANGAPLAALQLIETDNLTLRQHLFQALVLLSQKQQDPIQSAASVKELEPIPFLDFLLSWVMDLLRLQLGSTENEIVNQDFAKQLSALTQHIPLRENTAFMHYVQQLRAQLCAGLNMNKPLMMESVLIRWMECA